MTNQTRDPVAADAAAWNLPDADICSAAMALVHDVSPAFLTNHCIRSYLFGRELAAADGLRGGADYDDEALFLACLLHDLGITEYADGDQRFEVEGADAAARFLRERGMPEDRVLPVWQAIALHTSLGLAQRFGTVQELAFRGISLDVDGVEKSSLPAGFADRVHASWPRHDLGFAIAHSIAAGTRANPQKAPPFSFPAHLHEAINGSSVAFLDVVADNGWGDRPLPNTTTR
ncbi:HD domain-containing protein [Mycolicibacterium sp. GCM10028919]|uniref:HD domain-containing protein n=1 Tax=Mycolicibacterium sp. GCM10028919 TaxID=3273401 RepID=UPI00360C7562